MNRKLVLCAAAFATAFGFARCSSTPSQEPSVSLSAKPRTISDDGLTTATITINTFDEQGVAGTGMVHVIAAAGSLKGGQDATLADGKVDVPFTCNVATDALCKGSVRITATWSHAGKDYEASTLVTVANPDAGAGGGGGTGGASGGSGGGGGAGGGSGDAGMMNRLTLTPSHTGLVAGTGDKVDLAATVFQANRPVANAQVTFATTAGSFSAAPGTLMTTASTGADGGAASVTLFVADAPIGPITVTGTSMGLSGTARLNSAAVSNITYQTNPLTKSALGNSTSGRDTSTQVFFKVVDSSLTGVPGVQVAYKLDSQPAGASVSPISFTDDAGIASTTLQAGIGVGTATIRATVSATVDAGMLVETVHPGTPIVLGAPTFGGFTFSCAKRNLAALHTTGSLPPTRSPPVTTTCSVGLADGLNNHVAFRTSVQFSAEIGTITGPVDAVPGTGPTTATTTYSTQSSILPLDVTPIAGEPNLGSGRNPRDMTVTLIAIVAGSEEFWDGSGASNGVRNGRWDPGEWFIDLSEPYIDANDNGKYDPGEKADWDGARLNCATGMIEPANGRWDGPNGCYDSNTQLWRDFHVQLTGPLVGPLTFTPTQPTWTIAPSAMQQFNFKISDAWGSPSSTDSATMAVMQTGANVGTVMLNANLMGDDMGMVISYSDVTATESAAGSGVFTINGACNQLAPDPGNPLTRCIHRSSIDGFTGGSSGFITVAGKMPGTSADGGVRPISTGTVTLTATHAFSTPVQRMFNIDYQ